MKKAFTMLELIMVMVIMGIVASIGADIIASMYSNYLRSRTINYLESKTEITLEQIAKRLQYRIKDSVITRDANGNFMALSEYNNENGYNILEWIGYSNESFLGTPRPGWSGFIDLDSNETNRSVTPHILKSSESNLSDANMTISALTNGDINLVTSNHEAAIIFKGIAYNPIDFGWGNGVSNNDGPAVLKVRMLTNDIFQVSNDANEPSEISEQYYLTHTAYAIAPSVSNSTDFNLTLSFNYQPWLGEDYNNTTPVVLAEHVNLFRFKQDESILRLKLCLHDANQTGVGDRIVVCKEKVVY